MSADKILLEFKTPSEPDTKKDIVEQKPQSQSKRSQRDDSIDNDPTADKEEKEPLFVIDRTTNFKLNYTIQYESSSHKNNNSRYGSGARSDMGPRQNSCWNCGSLDHALSSCPETRNHWIISKNRKAFLLQKQQQQQNSGGRNRSSGRNNLRYFVASTKSMYSEFVPGQLSDDLLKALGLPENGLPLHVYRMRQHGYPSGWLEEARETYSGISIFTAPNERLPFPGRDNDNSVITCDINIKKLHKYPGFNSPCPPNTVDDCKTYGCPEFDPEQNLNIMYEKLKFNKKLIDFSENKVMSMASNSKDKITEVVMNSQSTEDESNDRPPSSPEDGEITDDEVCTEKNLLESTSEKPVDETSHSDTFFSCVDTKDSMNTTQSSLSTTNNSEFESPVCKKRKFGEVKSEILGTPVIKHVSPYTNRPKLENFAKGMVDIVEFENLPNSVGTFKKLKEILKDVRKTLNNIL